MKRKIVCFLIVCLISLLGATQARALHIQEIKEDIKEKFQIFGYNKEYAEPTNEYDLSDFVFRIGIRPSTGMTNLVSMEIESDSHGWFQKIYVRHREEAVENLRGKIFAFNFLAPIDEMRVDWNRTIPDEHDINTFGYYLLTPVINNFQYDFDWRVIEYKLMSEPFSMRSDAIFTQRLSHYPFSNFHYSFTHAYISEDNQTYGPSFWYQISPDLLFTGNIYFHTADTENKFDSETKIEITLSDKLKFCSKLEYGYDPDAESDIATTNYFKYYWSESKIFTVGYKYGVSGDESNRIILRAKIKF